MLSIGKLALGQQDYYEQQIAQGRDDYYTGRGEAPGEWAGAGAKELGLSGRVSAAQFDALLEGRDPRAMDRRLRAGNSEPSIAALDLTFSAPKSISVLFMVAPGEVSAALVACHEEAVRAALGWLEDEAVFVRRGKGGLRFERTGGLIAAAYRHRMSRALDPQLHTHVVCANLARGKDGRYTALHHPSIYRAAKTAGYLYQGHLRWLVHERLGLEWGPVHKGAGELREVPANVLVLFSRRRAEIEAVIADRETELGRPLTRSEREHWAALATRERKQYSIDTHTWREDGTALASEHGLDRALTDTIIRRGSMRVDQHELAVEGQLQLDGETVGESELGEQLTGPAGLTERSNTFDQGDVLREFVAAAPQGTLVATVREQLARFTARDDVLPTRASTLTCMSLVECEASLIDAAASRAGAGVAALPARLIDRAIARSGRTLNDDQVAAVHAVATSGNGVDVIEALAGTGKTYTAGVLRHVYETAGYTVLGVAPTNHSARELTEAGVTARTLDSRVLAINTGHDLPRRSVVILDEAGMAGTRLTERLLTNAAHVDAKVIAIGDPGQLASVQAGGWLAAISKRSGGVRLTEVERQRDRDERLALAGLHDGDPARWLQWAEPAGRVEVLHDGLEALQQTVSEWAAGAAAHGVEQSIMICRDNATREALNQLARDHRHGAGELGEQQAYGPITVAVGDRVICRDNSRDLDVDNGTRGTVRHIDHHRVVIETDAHLTRELPAGYVAEHVEHAYALTGHGMQGGTVEQARVLASPHELTRGWAYTALSRARGQTRLLVREGHLNAADRADYAPGRKPRRRTEREVLADVAHHMRERDDQDLAIDQLTPGRARDPQLRRPAVEPLEQDLAGAGGGAGHAQPARGELARLRDHLERLTAQLAALPTRELADIEDLDSRARDLTERRDAHRQQLAGLPAPKETWGGRVQDPHLVERSRLSSALAGVEEQLERILSARATLARQLGDPAAIRQEHHDLTDAIQDLRREHDTLRDQLVGDTVERQPRWLTETLGPRPDSGGERERWQHAAEQLARYRIEHDIPDSTSEPPLHPPTGRDRDQYDRASVDTQHDLDRG
jgi:conjugative relaxase-like TrwC/TraI family protein